MHGRACPHRQAIGVSLRSLTCGQARLRKSAAPENDYTIVVGTIPCASGVRAVGDSFSLNNFEGLNIEKECSRGFRPGPRPDSDPYRICHGARRLSPPIL